MNLANILDSKSVNICETKTTKKRVLEALSQHFADMSSLSSNTIFKEFLERERIGSTAIGHGVALPHIRMEHITKPIAALFVLRHPIDFGSVSQEPVDLIFGLLVPQDAEQTHLNTLSNIAELCNQENIRTQLRQAQTKHDLMAILSKQQAFNHANPL